MRLAGLVVLVACSGPPSQPTISHRSTEAPGRRVALAVVFNGWEVFAGNTTLVDPTDPAHYEGVLPGLDSDAAKLATIGTDGSLATLVVYNDRASVKRPLAPLQLVGPGWFGTQEDYYRKVGFDLISGLELAAATLATAPAGLERVILVLGDGCDTNLELARSRLAKIALANAGIKVHEIRIATKLSSECDVLRGTGTLHGTALTPGIDHFVAAFR